MSMTKPTSKLFWAIIGPVLFCMALMPSTALAKKKKDVEQPQWVTQPPSKAGMAYGIGSMEIYGNPQTAIQRATELARVDLVSQLQVTVSGDFSSTTTMSSGTHQESAVQKSMSNYVRSQIPTIELKEAKVADTWVDKKIAYVLVEVNRAREAAELELQIDDLDEQIIKIGNAAPASNSNLAKLQALTPALKLLAEREQLVERLNFISMQRSDSVRNEAVAQVEQSISRAVNDLKVRLVFKNQDAQELKNSLLEGLTQQGLRVSGDSNADLTFIVSVNLTYKEQANSHYTFAKAEVQIEDVNSRVLNAFSQEGKGVSGMADRSRQNAAQNLAKVLSQELAETLVEKIR